MVWFVILVMSLLFSALAYMKGIEDVVSSCDTYRAYKVDETKVVFCMVMPITEQRGVGEKEYLRPEGAKINQYFKRT